VVIPPRYPYQSGADEPPAVVWAKRLLDQRGNAPRLNRNMLVFAAMDEESMPTLLDQGKQFLAWDSIVRDKAQLNLDANQVQQATKNRDTASAKIDADLKVGYRWALAPHRAVHQDDGRWKSSDEEWRAIDTSQRGMFSQGGIIQRVGDALQAEERLLAAWSPMFLTRELERWFWSQGLEHISVKKLWEENLARYLYFPRLVNRDVLAKAITEGATTKDFLGYAAGIGADGRYLGLHIGQRPGAVLFDAESVLVRRDVALRQLESETTAEPPLGPGPKPGPGGEGHPHPPGTSLPKRPIRFYGSVKLNTLRLGSSAGQIGEEIVKHLTGLVDADVEVVLEVRAHVRSGIPEGVERTVGENAKTLKFQTFEFEDE
jgi:hypothetical protein